jgi:hypothetical protein
MKIREAENANVAIRRKEERGVLGFRRMLMILKGKKMNENLHQKNITFKKKGELLSSPPFLLVPLQVRIRNST